MTNNMMRFPRIPAVRVAVQTALLLVAVSQGVAHGQERPYRVHAYLATRRVVGTHLGRQIADRILTDQLQSQMRRFEDTFAIRWISDHADTSSEPDAPDAGRHFVNVRHELNAAREGVGVRGTEVLDGLHDSTSFGDDVRAWREWSSDEQVDFLAFLCVWWQQRGGGYSAALRFYSDRHRLWLPVVQAQALTLKGISAEIERLFAGHFPFEFKPTGSVVALGRVVRGRWLNWRNDFVDASQASYYLSQNEVGAKLLHLSMDAREALPVDLGQAKVDTGSSVSRPSWVRMPFPMPPEDISLYVYVGCWEQGGPRLRDDLVVELIDIRSLADTRSSRYGDAPADRVSTSDLRVAGEKLFDDWPCRSRTVGRGDLRPAGSRFPAVFIARLKSAGGDLKARRIVTLTRQTPVLCFVEVDGEWSSLMCENDHAAIARKLRASR